MGCSKLYFWSKFLLDLSLKPVQGCVQGYLNTVAQQNFLQNDFSYFFYPHSYISSRKTVTNNFNNNVPSLPFFLLLCISPWILLFQWWNTWNSWLKPFVMLCYAWMNFDDKAGIRFLEITVQIFLTPHKCSWKHNWL